MSEQSPIRQGIAELGMFEANIPSPDGPWATMKEGAGEAKFARYLSELYDDLDEFTLISEALVRATLESTGISRRVINEMPERFIETFGYVCFQTACSIAAAVEVLERRKNPMTIPEED